MSCSPRELLALAVELRALEKSEAVERCVVSRAYYAALHAVDQTFEARDQKFRVDGESSHAEIIGRATAYSSRIVPGRSDAAFIAKQSHRLRRERNHADYHIEKEMRANSHVEAIELATKILDTCDEVIRKLKAADALSLTGMASTAAEAVVTAAAVPARPRPTLIRIR